MSSVVLVFAASVAAAAAAAAVVAVDVAATVVVAAVVVVVVVVVFRDVRSLFDGPVRVAVEFQSSMDTVFFFPPCRIVRWDDAGTARERSDSG